MEQNCHRVAPVGQLGFDCRPYGHIHHRRGLDCFSKRNVVLKELIEKHQRLMEKLKAWLNLRKIKIGRLTYLGLIE